MHLVILQSSAAELAAFVQFWTEVYRDPREHLYEQNIGLPLTPERLRDLFLWKNGGPISRRKLDSLERNYIRSQPPLPPAGDASRLQEFICEPGGAIWRIFYLHCRAPGIYPIFDQHVYRAMRKILSGSSAEIPSQPAQVADGYVREYMPFYRRLQCGDFSERQLDRALWAFGKFMASPYGRLM